METSCLTGDRVLRVSPASVPKCMCEWHYHLETYENEILLFIYLIIYNNISVWISYLSGSRVKITYRQAFILNQQKIMDLNVCFI